MTINISDYADSLIVYLNTGDDVQSIVNHSPEGTVFVFEPGIYENLTITPKDNQTFIGEDGAVLKGSIPVDGWEHSGNYWSASYAEPAYSHGEGRDGMAQYTEDLLVDGTPYLRVATMAEVGPGTAYYENGRIYISDDPTGKTTEALSTTAAFIGGSTSGVTIANLTIENYASMAQHGAIDAHSTTNWTLIDLDVTGNHGAGVAAGDGMQILGGNYSDNGQVGIHAYDTTGLVIDGVTANNNNYAGFSETWDAGGIKILTSTDVKVVNSEIAGNQGAGLWFDWDNKGVTVENNWIHDNQSVGLFYEASYDAVIKGNNIGYNNKDGYTTGYWGADVLVNSSSNVSIVDNHVTSDVGQGIGIQQSARDPGAYGAHYTFNDVVSGNTIVMLSPGLNGMATDGVAGSYGNNTWAGNTYISDSPKSLIFTWDGNYGTAEKIEWQPVDKGGEFIYTSLSDIKVVDGFLTATVDYSVSQPAPSSVVDYTTGTDGTVTGSVTPTDNPDLNYAVAQGPEHGTVTVDQNGDFQYTATDSTATSDSFVTVGYDANHLASLQTVEIEIAAAVHVAGAAEVVQTVDAATGQASQSIVLTLTRTGSSAGESTVNYGVFGPGGSSQLLSSIFDHASGTVTFAAGETQKTLVLDASSAHLAGDQGYDLKLTSSDTSVTLDNTDFTGMLQASSAAGTGHLSLRLAGDAWNGAAEFAVLVDGHKVGVFSTTAAHADGQWQDINIYGNFDAHDAQSVSVQFLNDAWGGSAGLDRNLYVQSLTIDGQTYDASTAHSSAGWTRATDAPLVTNGTVTFDTSSDSQQIVLRVAGDAWNGNAEFNVIIDGKVIGGYSTSASHADGQWQDIVINGNFGASGPQSVGIQFTNDAWGGSSSMDRNLYVQSISVDGHTYDASTANSTAGWTRATDAPLVSSGTVTFDTSAESQQIVLRVSGDSWNGNPEFNVSIDGKVINGFTTNASHADGQWQDIVINGNFGDADLHNIHIDFTNDIWGTAGHDRNLYIDSIDVNGHDLHLAGQQITMAGSDFIV